MTKKSLFLSFDLGLQLFLYVLLALVLLTRISTPLANMPIGVLLLLIGLWHLFSWLIHFAMGDRTAQRRLYAYLVLGHLVVSIILFNVSSGDDLATVFPLVLTLGVAIGLFYHYLTWKAFRSRNAS